MKGLPLAYNRDMQEDKVHLFQAVDTAKDCLNLTSELLKHTSFDKNKFEKALDGDFSLSTELVDYLVRKNVPFRQAHNLVGAVVANCVEKNIKLNELTLKDYQKISQKFDKDLFKLLTSRSSINNKISQGSTSSKEVEKQLKYWVNKTK
jgi:argininosuccinate lyase